MASVVPIATSFYIAGSNEDLITDMLLVKLRKGKLKTIVGEKESLFSNIMMQAAVKIEECKDCNKTTES
jgi:hypothetical protein